MFAGWEVHIVKNCNRGLENFQLGRLRFLPYGLHFHQILYE